MVHRPLPVPTSETARQAGVPIPAMALPFSSGIRHAKCIGTPREIRPQPALVPNPGPFFHPFGGCSCALALERVMPTRRVSEKGTRPADGTCFAGAQLYFPRRSSSAIKFGEWEEPVTTARGGAFPGNQTFVTRPPPYLSFNFNGNGSRPLQIGVESPPPSISAEHSPGLCIDSVVWGLCSVVFVFKRCYG